MKPVVLAITVIATGAGCSSFWVSQPSPQDKLQMVAALVERDLSDPESYLAANAADRLFFLRIEGRDPPPGFVAKLSGPKAQFRPASEFTEGEMWFSVSEFEPRPHGGFNVHYSFHCGELCASSHTAVLKLVHGRWVAVSSRMHWISSAPPNKRQCLALQFSPALGS